MASDTYLYVGAIFKEARTRRNMTQRQVADRVGRSVSSIANIEIGRQRFHFDLFMKLCMVLHLDPANVVTRIFRDVSTFMDE